MNTNVPSKSGRSLRGYFSKRQASSRNSEYQITETPKMNQTNLGLPPDPKHRKGQYLKEVSVVSHNLGHNTQKLKRKADALKQSHYSGDADSNHDISLLAESPTKGRITANTNQPTEPPIQEHVFEPKPATDIILSSDNGPPAKRARRSKEDLELLVESSCPNAPLDVSTTASIKATFPQEGHPLSDYNLFRVLQSGLSAKQRRHMYSHDFSVTGVPKKGRKGRGQPALIEKEGKQYYAVVCGSFQLHGAEGTAIGLNVRKGKKTTAAINETLGDERVTGPHIPARNMEKEVAQEEATSTSRQHTLREKRKSIIDEGVVELSSSEGQADDEMEDMGYVLPGDIVSYIKDVEEQAIEWQSWGKKAIAAMGTAKALREETSTARQEFKNITGKYRAAREKLGEDWLKAIKES